MADSDFNEAVRKFQACLTQGDMEKSNLRELIACKLLAGKHEFTPRETVEFQVIAKELDLGSGSAIPLYDDGKGKKIYVWMDGYDVKVTLPNHAPLKITASQIAESEKLLAGCSPGGGRNTGVSR